MIMYVLVRIEDLGGDFTVDPCGVYSDQEDALYWVERLEIINLSPQSVIFDAIEFDADEEPAMFRLMEQQRQKLIDETDKNRILLCKKGMLEQLVDENGRFCYELTERGKKSMKDMEDGMQP